MVGGFPLHLIYNCLWHAETNELCGNLGKRKYWINDIQSQQDRLGIWVQVIELKLPRKGNESKPT